MARLPIHVVCVTCGKLVQVNKRFFGGIHSCRTDEDLQSPLERDRCARRYEYNTALLKQQNNRS